LKDNVVGFSRIGQESVVSLRLALVLQTVQYKPSQQGRHKREKREYSSSCVKSAMLT